MTPTGTKGIGELAMTGIGAAIANAVYRASGDMGTARVSKT